MRNLKIKNFATFQTTIEEDVLVDRNMQEYNLQSLSRDKTKSFWKLKESDNVIISLSNNHNNNINHAIAKCGASTIEKQHIINAVANPDILEVGRFW